MSATPELDEKALEAAKLRMMLLLWAEESNDAAKYHEAGGALSIMGRYEAEADTLRRAVKLIDDLSATSDAQAERVRVLDEALGDLEMIRSLGKAAFGGDWGVYSEEFGPHKGAVYIHANDVDADEDGLARDYGKRICDMADNDDDEANAAFIVACNVFVRRLLAKTARAALAKAGAPE